MRGRKESCGHTEAIQNLPPELREMILKEYISIKIKGKKEMGWGKVHENILKLPFCECEQKIVRMVICVEYPNCYFEGCCFSFLERGGGGGKNKSHCKLFKEKPQKLPPINAAPQH